MKDSKLRYLIEFCFEIELIYSHSFFSVVFRFCTALNIRLSSLCSYKLKILFFALSTNHCLSNQNIGQMGILDQFCLPWVRPVASLIWFLHCIPSCIHYLFQLNFFESFLLNLQQVDSHWLFKLLFFCFLFSVSFILLYDFIAIAIHF